MADQSQSFTTSNPPVPRQTPSAITLQPIATPTHGAGGSFSVISALHIAAPPDIAFTTVLEHSSWPEWNRFVRRVTISSAPAPPSSEQRSSPDATVLETAIAKDNGQRYIKKGTLMTFQVHLDPENEKSFTKQNMEVTLLEPFDVQNKKKGWRVAWKGTSIPGLLLRTERVQEFVDDGQGGTEYTCWETMYGPLAPVVRMTTGKSLEKGFEAWGVDLKARAEKIATESGGMAGVAAGGVLNTSR